MSDTKARAIKRKASRYASKFLLEWRKEQKQEPNAGCTPGNWRARPGITYFERGAEHCTCGLIETDHPRGLNWVGAVLESTYNVDTKMSGMKDLDHGIYQGECDKAVMAAAKQLRQTLFDLCKELSETRSPSRQVLDKIVHRCEDVIEQSQFTPVKAERALLEEACLLAELPEDGEEHG